MDGEARVHGDTWTSPSGCVTFTCNSGVLEEDVVPDNCKSAFGLWFDCRFFFVVVVVDFLVSCFVSLFFVFCLVGFIFCWYEYHGNTTFIRLITLPRLLINAIDVISI